MGTLWSLAVGVVGAVLTWIALNFVGGPIRKFFDLRTEIRRQVLHLGNVRRAEASDFLDQTEGRERHAKALAKLEAAREIFRELGTRTIAFGETEPLAPPVLRHFGFDTHKAGHGLVGLSNSLGGDPAEMAVHRRAILNGLRLGEPWERVGPDSVMLPRS